KPGLNANRALVLLPAILDRNGAGGPSPLRDIKLKGELVAHKLDVVKVGPAVLPALLEANRLVVRHDRKPDQPAAFLRKRDQRLPLAEAVHGLKEAAEGDVAVEGVPRAENRGVGSALGGIRLRNKS